jgi:ribosome-associated protein
MIIITPHISINEAEVKLSFVSSPGPGGQNVNKVATAVQLRFNVTSSMSLPEDVRERLITLLGKKITTQGDLIIKASRFRTQERNKQDAINRLVELIQRAVKPPKKRRKTKPTFSSVQKRLSSKKAHGAKKSMRKGGVEY